MFSAISEATLSDTASSFTIMFNSSCLASFVYTTTDPLNHFEEPGIEVNLEEKEPPVADSATDNDKFLFSNVFIKFIILRM